MGGAAVPPEFGVLNAVATLTQLQVLSLRLCSPAVTPWQQAQPQRVTLPGSLLRLKGLRCLDLSHTNIHRDTLELLPDFEGLEELILSGSVGDGDARLLTNTLPLVTGLTSLKLQYSPISSLPMGMAGLSRLRKLSWSCGRAKTTLMPLVFGSHAALRMDVVWRLTGLHSLTFSDDTMVALPAGITRLTQLTELSFEAINMSAPPVHLSNLISLQAISIKSRHLAAVMEGVTNLTQLKQVIVSNLQALPPAAKAFVEARTPAWLRGG
jgi:Leucine-rich repeat (LRR) protein